MSSCCTRTSGLLFNLLTMFRSFPLVLDLLISRFPGYHKKLSHTIFGWYIEPMINWFTKAILIVSRPSTTNLHKLLQLSVDVAKDLFEMPKFSLDETIVNPNSDFSATGSPGFPSFEGIFVLIFTYSWIS